MKKIYFHCLQLFVFLIIVSFFAFTKSNVKAEVASSITSPTLPCVPMIQNGNSADKIDVIFMGIGYSQSQIDLFKNDAETFMNKILEVEPYNSFRNIFNFYRLDDINNASDFNCATRDIHNMCNFSKIRQSAFKCGDFDNVYAILNADYTKGGAFRNISENKGYAFLSRDGVVTKTVVHEFSHTFGLSDEYFYYKEGNLSVASEIDNLNNMGTYLNCGNYTCSKWCSSTYSTEELKEVDCSSKDDSQCVSATKSGKPCGLIDKTIYGLEENKCVNTVALCTSMTTMDKCLSEKDTYRRCMWKENLDPILQARCVPTIGFSDGALWNINVGKSCKANYGCYRGCSWGTWSRSSVYGGIMQNSTDYSSEKDAGFSPAALDTLTDIFSKYPRTNSVVITPTTTPTTPTTLTTVQPSSEVTNLQSQLQTLQQQLTVLQQQTTTSATSSPTTQQTQIFAPTIAFNSSLYSTNRGTAYGINYATAIYILSWGSVNSTSCSSNFKEGILPTTGSEKIGMSPDDVLIYTLTCTGAGGSTSKAVTLGPATTQTTAPATNPAETTQVQTTAPTTTTPATVVSTATTTPPISTATATSSQQASTSSISSKPDLMIYDFSITPQKDVYQKWESISLKYSIKNIGAKDSSAFNVTTLNKTNGRNMGSLSWTNLLPGALTFNGGTGWSDSSYVLSEGYNLIEIRIDGDNLVDESNENNNVATFGILVSSGASTATTTTSTVSSTTSAISSSPQPQTSTTASSITTSASTTPLAIVSPATSSSSTPSTTAATSAISNNVSATPNFTISTPTAGEHVVIGSTYTIRWQQTTGNSATVRMSLYQGGYFKDFIVANTPNTGSYQWKVPSTFGFGFDYSVRIFDMAYPNNYTDSARFSIVSPTSSSASYPPLASILSSMSELMERLSSEIKSFKK
jgi:hypothetical protein